MAKYYFNDLPSALEGADSDLACERRRADTSLSGVDYRKERAGVGYWERITISSEEGAESIGRPRGYYDTLNLPPMSYMDCDEIDEAKNELSRELCRICELCSVNPENILTVGIGNAALTPDAVGPMSADKVCPTNHIKKADSLLFDSLECSSISVIKPGVAEECGIECADIIGGICTRLHPSLIIAIDALSARAPERLGRCIQISSTGIQPGSGFGTLKKALNEQSLGIPVIAIGVPTVINSKMFVGERREVRAKERGEGMFLAPCEINRTVQNASRIIGEGINQAFGIDYR